MGHPKNRRKTIEAIENKALDVQAVKESYCSAQAALRYASYFKGSPRLKAKDRREKKMHSQGLSRRTQRC